MVLRAAWYRYLLRFGWRHMHGRFGLGCAQYLGRDWYNEPKWLCRLHGVRLY